MTSSLATIHETIQESQELPLLDLPIQQTRVSEMAPFSTATTTRGQPKDFTKNVPYGKHTTQESSKEINISYILDYLSNVKWFNVVALAILHGTFLKGIFIFPWIQYIDLVLFNIMYGSIGACGITAGAHRLWTHRSYKAKLPLRIIWMLSHTSFGISPIFDWVRDHRLHHKYTDTDADPYNATRGFFFSHIGWLFVKKHPLLIEKGKQIDMSDVMEDPVIQFHQKYYMPLIFGVGFILPTIIPPLLWGAPWVWSLLGTCVGRYCIGLNLIWTVNSVSHAYGTRPFDKYVSATDNPITSFLTLGESWHNFHHTFPWSYRLGRFTGYLTDVPCFWIDQFAKIGWAYDMKTPSVELIQRAARRAGDGSDFMWGEHMEIPESAEQELLNKKIWQ